LSCPSVPRNAAYRVRASITVAMVSRTMRGIPVEVTLGPEDGMPDQCAVNLDNILTIPKARLMDRITTLPAEKMVAVARAIFFALDLPATL